MQLPALTEHRNLRFTAFTAFYVAQGLPIGLLSIAMPAWLAGQGVAAGTIATFVAISSLPWGLKLVVGPLMDRFTYLPMGRRRPWVILAEIGIGAAIVPLAFVPDPAANVGALTACGFMINAFAAAQDVAVDGMAIDVLPVDERGRANAFMAFGQVAGYSGSASICAAALARWGLPGAVLFLVAGVTVIALIAIVVRERPLERLVPWSAGVPSARALELQSSDGVSILFNLIKVLFLPTSLLLIVLVWFYRAPDGFFISAAPVIAVQQLGWSDTDYSNWMAISSGTAAIFGLLVGPMIDRHGSKRLIAISLSAVGMIYLMTGLASNLWHLWYVPLIALFCIQWTLQVVFIAVIAIHMSICWPPVSATQFAIYMAWANLARSGGAKLYGAIADQLPPGGEFLIMGVFSLVGASILIWIDLDKHQARLDELSSLGEEPLTRSQLLDAES